MKRNINIDLARIFAAFSVICVHFFLNNSFYTVELVGMRMFIMCTIKTFAMICVPLFLIITGYVSIHKELNKNYYKGLIKVLVTYLIVGILQWLFMKYYFHKEMTFIQVFNFIMNIDVNYSWYVNMYIGLFLLIPFLNILYNNLKSKNEKKYLIITLLLLTSLPSVLLKNKLLVSNWWINLYPITYYYIGTYLREYGFYLKKSINIILVLVLTIGFSIINYCLSTPNPFIKYDFCQFWGGIMPLVLSVLVFIFFINLKINIGTKFGKFITKISTLTLGTYLSSWIYDNIVYSYLIKYVPKVTKRLNYFLPCVIIIFICSIVTAYFVSIIVNFIINIKRRKNEKN